MVAAYPVHPELFLMLQADWGGLEKFQKTRGVLKMMAQIVYRLWREGHAAPNWLGCSERRLSKQRRAGRSITIS
jgi:predicted AAA+ superfamily ATPase